MGAIDLERLETLWGRSSESFADRIVFDSAYEEAFPTLVAAAKSHSALVEERGALRARVAALESAVAAEREACAKIFASERLNREGNEAAFELGACCASHNIEDAIRARAARSGSA